MQMMNKFVVTFKAKLSYSKLFLTAFYISSFMLSITNVFAEKINSNLGLKSSDVQIIDSVGCAENLNPPNVAKTVVDSDGKQLILVPLTKTPRSISKITADISDSAPDADGKCVNTTKREYKLNTIATPEVSEDALIKSFQIIMAAFVLALLLESAFALIFNWRVFQIFFAGRAWKSPIMFLASFLAVREFNMDLIGTLVNLYNPNFNVSSKLVTQIFTAMILAGGSVGVNKIFIGLGFRSRLETDNSVKPGTTRAWLSIVVNPENPDKQYAISIEEVKNSTKAGDPILKDIVGIAGTPKPKLRDVLFGNRYRVPSMRGGLQIDSTKIYYIKIIDVEDSSVYDIQGREITSQTKQNAFSFAPGAVLDLIVKIESKET